MPDHQDPDHIEEMWRNYLLTTVSALRRHPRLQDDSRVDIAIDAARSLGV